MSAGEHASGDRVGEGLLDPLGVGGGDEPRARIDRWRYVLYW
jgi:hypothetical protein